LYECVEQTVDQDLPQELAYLEAYDRFSAGIQAMVDMPDRKVNLLHRFLNQGKVSFQNLHVQTNLRL